MTTWLLQKIIYLGVILTVAVIGAVKYKKLNLPYKYLMLIVVATFIFETIAIYSAYTFKNNQVVYDIFDCIEITGFVIVFYLLYTNIVFKKIIIAFTGIFLLLKIAFHFFKLPLITADALLTIKNAILIIASLLLFLNWLNSLSEEKLYKHPSFWFATVVLFFYTVNFLFWSTYSTKFFNSKPIQLLFSEILYYSNIVFYIVLGYVLFLASKLKHTQNA